MNLLIELLKFLGCLTLLLVISKFVLVKALRVLAESLGLKSKIVGEIAGFATSVPELLTVVVASMSGLMGTGAYNILSSNVINLILYTTAVLVNKNGKVLKNKALSTDLLLVVGTILIPSLMMIFGLQTSVAITPILFAMFFAYLLISRFAHKRYPMKEDAEWDEEIQEEANRLDNKRRNALLSAGAILVSGVALYLVSILMGGNLKNLTYIFNIPELVLGIVLGFVTSIPELITFFESQRYHKEEENRALGVVEATSNLLMSNMFNLFIILALGTLIFFFAH